MPAVEVEELTKRYGDRLALDGVSFAVEAGECLAVLGPNGAGKSTLVDLLATVASPDGGRARVAGHRVGEAPGRVRERVGVAFQRPIVHEHLTARELVLHQARLYGVPRARARERAGRLLAFVDLDDRADERVGAYSDGMKRRADLARVLVTDPDVLLLDEPTAGLDPRGRRAFRERLARLRDGGTTLVLATHQPREVRELADRVAILHEGRLRALDRPGELTASLGDRVVRVRLPADGDPEPAREALAAAGVAGVRVGAEGLEATLAGADPSPGDVVDALERADVAYEDVHVGAPDLADAFLHATGDRLAPGEGAA